MESWCGDGSIIQIEQWSRTYKRKKSTEYLESPQWLEGHSWYRQPQARKPQSVTGHIIRLWHERNKRVQEQWMAVAAFHPATEKGNYEENADIEPEITQKMLENNTSRRKTWSGNEVDNPEDKEWCSQNPGVQILIMIMHILFDAKIQNKDTK